MEILKKVRSLDLNLLTAFELMERTRSVTRSAKLLGLSQPAMSHVLSRMRQALGDPLFVKTPREMVPTPRALQIAPIVHRLLEQIECTILDGGEFEPHTLDRTFSIKTTDFIEAQIMPRLIAGLEHDAPLVKVSVTAPEFRLPREVLEQGFCDIAIGGFFDRLPDGFYQQKVFEDDFVCAVRRNHPRLGKRKSLSVEAFCGERHLLIAPGGELNSKLDGILKNKKMSRIIVAGCSSYMGTGWVLEKSDTLLTAPRKLITLLADRFDLNILPLPTKIPKITVVQVWHERNHNDPAHRWFRKLIQSAFIKEG